MTNLDPERSTTCFVNSDLMGLVNIIPDECILLQHLPAWHNTPYPTVNTHICKRNGKEYTQHISLNSATNIYDISCLLSSVFT